MSLSFLSVPHFLLVCSLWFWSCAHCSQLCCGCVFFTYFVLLEINTYMVALSRFLPPTSDFSGVGISSRSTLELLLGVLFPGGALFSKPLPPSPLILWALTWGHCAPSPQSLLLLLPPMSILVIIPTVRFWGRSSLAAFLEGMGESQF